MRATIALLTSVPLAGCVAHLGGGAAFNTTGAGAPHDAWIVALRFPKAPRSAPVVGVRTVWTASDPTSLVSLRAAMVSGGWLLRPRRTWSFGFEGTLETGMGQPMERSYEGTGLYAGLAANLLWRIASVHDTPGRHTMRIVALSLDLGLGARGGYWSPPREHPDDGTLEGTLELSLRVNVLSEMVLSRTLPGEEE